jgi:hypothetical protein
MEKKALKARGTVSEERSVGGVPGGRTEGGRGMLGGVVLDRKAAKYKQRAGPETMISASALARVSSSRSLSALACARASVRNLWNAFMVISSVTTEGAAC